MALRIGCFALQCSMLAIGCGGSNGTPCTRNDQCPSHFCRADETCGPELADAALHGDGPGDAISGTCTPDHDGQISLAELPLIAGRTARFRIATNATWNTAGTSNQDGSRTWDLSGPLSGDADAPITLATPAGAWWQSAYPSATYAAPLSSSSTLLGVFEVSASSVTLLGVVSPDAGNSRTQLAYAPPAKILAIPFAAGATWTSTSTVTGTAEGILVDYDETYQSTVDQVGTMTTPYGAFPVLRVATDLTRVEGVVTVLTNRTFAWVAECFGSVATVQSQSSESGAEFSDDAEVERLVP